MIYYFEPSNPTTCVATTLEIVSGVMTMLYSSTFLGDLTYFVYLTPDIACTTGCPSLT